MQPLKYKTFQENIYEIKELEVFLNINRKQNL